MSIGDDVRRYYARAAQNVGSFGGWCPDLKRNASLYNLVGRRACDHTNFSEHSGLEK